MKLHILTLWLALAMLATAGLAQTESELTREGKYWVQTVTESVALGASRNFRVTTRGEVVIHGRPAEGVSYSLRKLVRAKNEPDARRVLSTFRATATTSRGWAELTVSCSTVRAIPELSVTVPRNLTRVALLTQDGDIRASHLHGDLEAESEGGRIEADAINGRFLGRTGGGETNLGRIGGEIRYFSGGGGIRVALAGAKSRFETAGGEITIDEAVGPVYASTLGGNITVGRAASSVFARTAGGVIRVKEAVGEVVAETANGSIQVGSARGVQCESAAGAIRLLGVTGMLRASTASGSILAELLETAELADSTLHTSSGDVTVWIPSKLAVTVRAYNTPAGISGRIVSEFPEIRVDAVRLPTYQPVVAQGALNGGGPLLKISAVGGTIYLRRRE